MDTPIWLEASALVAALGSGLVAGVFFAFSTFVMKALAKVVRTEATAVTAWADYVRTWTAWNHVRTVASLVAAAAFTLALAR